MAEAELTTPRRAKASPLARRVAAELGVDLDAVTGTGRLGRILKADVRASATTSWPAATTPSPPATTSSPGAATSSPAPSWAWTEVDVSAALALCGELAAVADVGLSDLIVAAAARSLRELGEQRIDVAIGDAVVRDAAGASLGHVARQARRLDATGGATFTVKVLDVGAFGGGAARTLCVGAVRDRAWPVDGRLELRPVSTLTLTAAGEDHAARLLAAIQGLLEEPLRLIA